MAKSNTPSLALGTVQFGLPYGITNPDGQVAPEEVSAILDNARNHNPSMVLDTSPGYGTSEAVLGTSLKSENFRIVTKTNLKAPDIQTSISGSLKALNKTSVYGLLDHNAHFLKSLAGQETFRNLQKAKDNGLTQKIGASVYDGNDIDHVMPFGQIDILQIPMNVLDQRLIESGHLRKMKDAGIEIHIRSAFLQGLLLTEPQNIPASLSQHESIFEKFDQLCKDHNLSALQATLAFLRSQPEIDHIVVGVTSAKQLEDITSAFACPLPDIKWSALSYNDPALLNPANWPKAA